MIAEALIAIFIAYAALLAICIISKNRRVSSYCSIIVATLTAFCIGFIAFKMSEIDYVFSEGSIYIDKISLIFMSLVAFVALVAVLYSDGYIGYEADRNVISQKDVKQYYIIMNLFIAILYVTFIVNSVALVWLCVGATTLVSTFLVGFYKNPNSTEAAWKYMIICSVGITVALVGITLMYAATVGVISDANSALDWVVLMENASKLNPNFMKMAVVLMIIGYGTKVGFAPMHTWLPDAHSQAPTPVSGMLSAVLLNCALYAIVRVVMISQITVPGFAKTILLIFGILSLAVAAMFIITSKDLKRMLAYSSIENMGLIAIGLGIGTEIAIFGALIQLIAHSVTKPMLFYAAGNIIQKYNTRDMTTVRGVRERMPFTSFMMAAGALIMVGVPPFAIFMGEFNIIFGTIDAQNYAITVIVLILLVLVFAGMTRHVFNILSGHTDEDITEHKGALRIAPFVIMFITTLVFGIFMPDQLSDFLHEAARMIGGLI